ncbi:MAG: Fe-S cluster assembly ATPase SufC [Patescibacteria group bacterium]
MNILEIKNLKVAVGEKIILNDVSLTIKDGETCLIMGPNGSGKSTLSSVIMGHPAYQVLSGQILFRDQDITNMKPEERARLGLFMSFQQPREVSGVDFYSFLFDAYKEICTARSDIAVDAFDFRGLLDEELARLNINSDWSDRSLNQGFSGGEKKKAEMLQLAMLHPKLAIFDEIDSGLDVDALEVVGSALARFKTPTTSALIVTHYQRILKYIKPDQVLVMSAGKIVASGGADLAERLEREGFTEIIKD